MPEKNRYQAGSTEAVPGLAAADVEAAETMQRFETLKEQGERCHASLRRANARMEALQDAARKGKLVDLMEVAILRPLIERENTRAAEIRAELDKMGGAMEALTSKVHLLVEKTLKRRALLGSALHSKGGRA